MTGHIVLITGASSGFGAGTARRLADDGHTVYAGIRDTTGRKSRRRRTTPVSTASTCAPSSSTSPTTHPCRRPSTG